MKTPVRFTIAVLAVILATFPGMAQKTENATPANDNYSKPEDKDKIINDLTKQLKQAEAEIESLQEQVWDLKSQLQGRHGQEENQPEEPKKKTDCLEATELAQQFKDDPAAAKQKYRGQQVMISGIVEQISRCRQVKGEPTAFEIRLQTQPGLKTIRCILAKPTIYQSNRPYGRGVEFDLILVGALGDETLAIKRTTKTHEYDWQSRKTKDKTLNTETATLLSKGQNVKLRGLCTGERISIDIKNCDLVDFEFPLTEKPLETKTRR